MSSINTNFELLSQMFFNLVHQFAFSQLGHMNSFTTKPVEKEGFIHNLVDFFVLRLTHQKK